jgi:hypothetical protein
MTAESWQRPAFEPGNQLATKHGAYSPAKVDPVAQAYVDALLADPDVDYLRRPSFLPAIWAWARAEARVQLLTEWVADKPPVEGKPLPALEQLRQWESTAAKARDRLGLNPVSQAALHRDRAIGAAVAVQAVEHAKASGRALVEAHEESRS